MVMKSFSSQIIPLWSADEFIESYQIEWNRDARVSLSSRAASSCERSVCSTTSDDALLTSIKKLKSKNTHDKQ